MGILKYFIQEKKKVNFLFMEIFSYIKNRTIETDRNSKLFVWMIFLSAILIATIILFFIYIGLYIKS